MCVHQDLDQKLTEPMYIRKFVSSTLAVLCHLAPLSMAIPRHPAFFVAQCFKYPEPRTQKPLKDKSVTEAEERAAQQASRDEAVQISGGGSGTYVGREDGCGLARLQLAGA